MSNIDRFLADMSRAEELQMIEECLTDIVQAGRVDPDTINLACLVARFVHLVAEREAQDDADIWAHIIGDEGCDSP